MKPFQKVYLEITSVCNLSCSFCPPTERRAEFIKPDEFRRRLQEVKLHTSLVALHVKGEPLLHPKLDHLLDACKEEGLQAVITTNGTLIGKMRDKLLGKPALRQVNLSLHSFEGNDPERLDAYLAPLFAFARDAADSGIHVSFRLWNGEEKEEGASYWSHNRLLLERLSAYYPTAGELSRPLAPGSGIKLAERVYLNRDLVFEWPSLNAPEDDGAGFCYGLRTQAAVLANGTVVPCCLDGEGVINLGNLQEASFADIIESERALRLKEGFSRRTAVEELCRKCGYRRKFG
ncbi:radical SAM/SPASM domain-containing protein [Gorillibacterium timonense]|uniref:radical SAM/SPASM domain-containing protein n=1 Tax=Gorillibacterium timonense TaxID=1689269 RepID=UPI00071DCE70|nr:radical SAM/SPASM domain-containing protein [Gorillibacterium timonense]